MRDKAALCHSGGDGVSQATLFSTSPFHGEVENENFPRIYETRVSSSPQRTFLFTFCSLQIHLQLPLLQKIQGEDPSNPYSRSEA